MSQNNGVKIPGWAVGSIVTIFITAFGFWGMWSVARADVDNLKKDVDQLKPVATAVAVINDKIPRIESDIKEIKSMQEKNQTQQRQFQAEIQRDIKSLLQKIR